VRTKVYLLYAPPEKMRGAYGLVYPPLGILYLAAYLREHLSDVEIKAADGYRIGKERVIREILEYAPDILGVSFTTQSSTGAYSVINEVKRGNEKVFVVCGGPHPTAMPEEVLLSSRADRVVIGEGEITFLELVKAYREGFSCHGLLGTAERIDDKTIINPPRPLIRDLDTIPFPARDLLDIAAYPGYYYKRTGMDTSMISSRGCPFNCVFCANPVWKVQKPWYRVRSPKNVVNEMEHIAQEYGIMEIFDQSDEFNASLAWAKKVCDELIERQLDISLKAQMRVDNIDDELAKKMSEAGFWLALIGVESANDEPLLGIEKHITISQVEQGIGHLRRYGMKVLAYLMAFNVWEENAELRFEDKEGAKKTLAWAKELIKKGKLDFITWSLTTPLPGSELYEIAVRHRLILPEIVGMQEKLDAYATGIRWEEFDSSSTFVLSLPGIEYNDWLDIKNMGARLQAWLLLKSGAFNIRALSLYLQRALSLLLRTCSSLWYRVLKSTKCRVMGG